MLEKIKKGIDFIKVYILKVVIQRTNRFFLVCVCSCVIALMISLLIDCCLDFSEIGDISIELQMEDVYIYVINKGEELSLDLTNFCSMVLTIDTILAAAVIFFYSMIDNRKIGIPHRAIITYTFGSLMIPGVFLGTIFLLPIMYMAYLNEMFWTTFTSIFFSYIFQIIIIILILISTSYDFSVRAVCYEETRQFEFMMGDDVEQKRKKRLYQIGHMEQVILSDDVGIEKIKMISALLKVPFYERRRFFDIGIVPKKLYSLNAEYLYNYYYTNMNLAFYQIKDNLQKCQKMYEVLYIFLDEFCELYMECKKKLCSEEEIKKARENYRVVVAAILNATTEANSINVMQFANEVLRKQKDYDRDNLEEQLFNTQAVLYLYYLQFRFYVYAQPESERQYQIIDGDKLELDISLNIEYYERYWSMWKKQVTLSCKESYFYFWSTLSVEQGELVDDSPLCFIVNKKKGCGCTNDSEGNRASK